MAARFRIFRSDSHIPLQLQMRQVILTAAAISLWSATNLAQTMQPQGGEPRPQSDEQSVAPNQTPLIIPGGTPLALVLTHPVDSKYIHRGDQVYAETTFPVSSGGQVVIPAGSFVQGRVEKLTLRGSRADLVMQSVAVILPDGYTLNLAGPLTIVSTEGTAWRNPTEGERLAMISAPLVGVGLGMLIGSAAHTTQSIPFGETTITRPTPKGIGIGAVAGGVAGGLASLIVLARSRHFYIEVGAPLEMVLPQAVTLAQGRSTIPNLESGVRARTGAAGRVGM